MARRIVEHPEIQELRQLLRSEYVRGESFRDLVFLTARHGLIQGHHREQLRACCFALLKSLGMSAEETANVMCEFVTRLGHGDDKSAAAVHKLVSSYAKRRASYDRNCAPKPNPEARAANAYAELPSLLCGRAYTQAPQPRASAQQPVAPVVSMAEFRARRTAGKLPTAS